MSSRRFLRSPTRHMAAGALVAAWCLASCSGSSDLAGPDAGGGGQVGAVASVVITPSTSSLPVGAAMPFQAEAHDAAGHVVPGATIFWSSSDTTITTVSSAGVARARAIGTAQIAASAGGQSAVATLTVTPVPVASVAVLPGAGTVSIGATIQLAAVAYNATGGSLTGRQVAWASGAPQVARVDANGLVTGVTAGTAQITATVEGKTGATTITVALIPVASVSVSPTSLALTVGQVAAVAAVARDAQGNELAGRGVTWSSADPGVAKVTGSGLVTAVGAGTTTITATSEGQSATTQVVVSNPPPGPPPAPEPVASVLLTPSTASITVGGGLTFAVTTTDAHGNVLTGRTIAWTSSAPQIATVDANGTIAGVAPGTVTITAASEGKSATAQITVNAPPPPPPAPVATVTVSPPSATLTVGGTTVLTATVSDASNNALTGRSITWLTSDANVATVSSTGTVTAVGPGTATITAGSEGRTGTAQITVNAPPPVPVATVTLTPTTAALTPGGSVTLTAATLDASRNTLDGRAVSWMSSAPAVATVNASGTVTAVAPGTATITATSEGKSATAQITVNAPPPPPPAPVASVTVSPASLSLTVGQTSGLNATTRDASGTTLTGRSVAWSSTNTSVATVSTTGIVTAVAAGTATITATSEGHAGSASVTVTAPAPPAPAPVDHIVVTPSSVQLQPHNSVTLTARVYDAKGTLLSGRTITWQVSDTKILTINPSVGATVSVYRNKGGTATVTATSEGKSVEVTVTVGGD